MVRQVDIHIGGVSNDLLKLIINIAHPVGSYYITEDNTNPQSIFGGTWAKVQAKFLFASGSLTERGTTFDYDVGYEDGQRAVLLKTEHMPSHSHPIDEVHGKMKDGILGTDGPYGGSERYLGFTSKVAAYNSTQYSISRVGGDTPHYNMPPYRVVNMWRRTG